MKKSVAGIGAAVAVAALVVVGAQSANALTLYENSWYTGATYIAWPASSVGALNDKASSTHSVGSAPTYHEDINYGGRAFSVAGDIQDLTSLSTNLHFGETWNDRISSFN